MRLLLDTHAFLWFIDDNPRLSSSAKTLLESDNDLLLSTVSLWEIAIKFSLGKLGLPEPFSLVADCHSRTATELAPFAAFWGPYRSVAARRLWQLLRNRRRRGGDFTDAEVYVTWHVFHCQLD